MKCPLSFLPLLLSLPVAAADVVFSPSLANSFEFTPVEARAVRVLVHATNGSQPCLDELEVFGPASKENLARGKGARASASSCLEGYPQHQIPHLNDGAYGNGKSWIAARVSGDWARIDFPDTTPVDRVVLSRDREGQYADRIPTDFEIQTSIDGETWKTVRKVVARVRVSRQTGVFRGAVAPPPPVPKMDAAGKLHGVGTKPTLDARQANELGLPNLARRPGVTARASSALQGHKIHQIKHLSDGLGGNDNSWIAGEMPAWAEIDLGGEFWVTHVAFGNDAGERYLDRAANDFTVALTTDTTTAQTVPRWQDVFHGTEAVVGGAVDIHFTPARARRVRIVIDSARGGLPRIDEIEVFGQTEPIPPDKVAAPTKAPDRTNSNEKLRTAFLAEEHAWLKVAGEADLSSRLIPYNGRVKEYPKRRPIDVLPLPPLATAPILDGVLDDDAWARSSRGVARVAWPYDFELGPLIECAVSAGSQGGRLFLGIEVTKLLSGHVVVVSAGDGAGCGAVAMGSEGGEFRTFERVDRSRVKLLDSRPVELAFNPDLTVFECSLPLDWFEGWEESGIRVGLGMGGRHTAAEGRAVSFVPAPCFVRELPSAAAFELALGAMVEGAPANVAWGEESEQVGLAAHGATRITVPAVLGPIGPEQTVAIEIGDTACKLHLRRYDPVPRVLAQTHDLLRRLEHKGIEAHDLRAQLGALEAATSSRETFLLARLLKRKLTFRDPDLAPLRRLLFVKRQPFHPSHNYSVILDSPWRPGGAVCTLDIPIKDGELEPESGRVTRLFEAGKGVARTPMATADADRIYFSYRESKDDYFRIMSMEPDGSSLQRLTEGPFHDFWPCPLPDGGLGFISTRCRARFLCWRPQAFVLFRMNPDGSGITPLSFANLSEWAPSVMSDGRILWTRSEYLDKGADFSHTLWAIRPDGTKPELVFGNTIIQPNGYANGRQVPGTNEICATLISHFGDLNGPIALLDIDRGRFSKDAITSITPEVPWPGMWPMSECFRDPVPISRDHVLCAHAPRDRFGLYVIDRFGNRELLHLDDSIGSVCPTPLRVQPAPPVLAGIETRDDDWGVMTVDDVYQGIPQVERGCVRYLRIAGEARAELLQMPDGSYQKDHQEFVLWYAAPVDRVSGPFGWPSYVAKASYGLVPVEPDGSAHFRAPAGKVLYLQALDENLNELQRMRSVVQLQPGEKRSCIGCHEDRRRAPAISRRRSAHLRRADSPDPPPWGTEPLDYATVVQPVLDRNCVRCHTPEHVKQLDFSATLDKDRIPASYRTLIRKGLVHHLDYRYNAGGNEKREALSFGALKSKLFQVLEAGHNNVKLLPAESRALKCWVDMNCPLWPDYQFRNERPLAAK